MTNFPLVSTLPLNQSTTIFFSFSFTAINSLLYPKLILYPSTFSFHLRFRTHRTNNFLPIPEMATFN